MKKVFITLLLMLFAIFSANSVQAAYDPISGKTIAIWHFENKAAQDTNLSPHNASLLIDFFAEQLVDAKLDDPSRQYKILDRAYVKGRTDEIGFGSSGMVDTYVAARAGKQLGAQLILVGSITNLSVKEGILKAGADFDHKKIKKVGTGGAKHTVTANISARFIDVETGEIVMTVSGVGKSSSTLVELDIDSKYYEDYETDNADSSDNPTPGEGKESHVASYNIKIGTEKVSLVQARNALYKAVLDSVDNKKYGLFAKMDGVGKRRKV